jgi:hypothetical protein
VKRSRTHNIIIASAAALTPLTGRAAVGAAIAGGPIDSSGVVHGCDVNSPVNGLLAIHRPTCWEARK